MEAELLAQVVGHHANIKFLCLFPLYANVNADGPVGSSLRIYRIFVYFAGKNGDGCLVAQSSDLIIDCLCTCDNSKSVSDDSDFAGRAVSWMQVFDNPETL